MKIVSRGYTEGYYYKPRVDLELLREFHEGIIALSACLAGEVQKISQEACTVKEEQPLLGMRKYLEKGIFSWSCRIMGFRSSRRSIRH